MAEALVEKKSPNGTVEFRNAKGIVRKKITASGQVQWFDDDGKLHRADGPAVENADGSTMWMCHGKEHRVNGPAIETPEKKEWYRDGKLHREKGPAVEHADGKIEWYRNGRKLKPDVVKALLAENAEIVAKDVRSGLDHKMTLRRGPLKLKKRPDANR